MEYIQVGRSKETVKRSPKNALGKISDRRGTPRKAIDLTEVQALAKTHSSSTKIIDLSFTGAQITGKPERLHSEIQLQLVLPNSLKPMIVKGKVVWAQSAKYEQVRGREECMGILFTELSTQDQAQLRRFVETTSVRMEKPSSPNPEFFVTDEEIDQLLQNSLK